MSIFNNKIAISKWYLFACCVVKSVLWVKFSWKDLVKYTQWYNHNNMLLSSPSNTHQVALFICLQLFKCQPGHQWCRHWSESLSKKRSFLQSPRGGHCPIGPGEICSKTDVFTWKVWAFLKNCLLGQSLEFHSTSFRYLVVKLKFSSPLTYILLKWGFYILGSFLFAWPTEQPQRLERRRQWSTYCTRKMALFRPVLLQNILHLKLSKFPDFSKFCSYCSYYP